MELCNLHSKFDTIINELNTNMKVLTVQFNQLEKQLEANLKVINKHVEEGENYRSRLAVIESEFRDLKESKKFSNKYPLIISTLSALPSILLIIYIIFSGFKHVKGF